MDRHAAPRWFRWATISFQTGDLSERGTTLVELILATAITTVAVSLFSAGVFQVLSVERYWRDDSAATRAIRSANSAVATDALNATSTDLILGGAVASTVSLQWADALDQPHTSVFRLTGTTLERVYDGTITRVTDRVQSIEFSLLSDNRLRFDITVERAQGDTDSARLETYIRMLNQ